MEIIRSMIDKLLFLVVPFNCLFCLLKNSTSFWIDNINRSFRVFKEECFFVMINALLNVLAFGSSKLEGPAKQVGGLACTFMNPCLLLVSCWFGLV